MRTLIVVAVLMASCPTARAQDAGDCDKITLASKDGSIQRYSNVDIDRGLCTVSKLVWQAAIGRSTDLIEPRRRFRLVMIGLVALYVVVLVIVNLRQVRIDSLAIRGVESFGLLLLAAQVTVMRLALRSTPQIAHRLEVKRQGDGTIVIDDAYNSNPVGFASALGLLDVLQRPGGRRILVTPGMVELGAAHHEEHERIGRLAAEHVDVLVAVAPPESPKDKLALLMGNSGAAILYRHGAVLLDHELDDRILWGVPDGVLGEIADRAFHHLGIALDPHRRGGAKQRNFPALLERQRRNELGDLGAGLL